MQKFDQIEDSVEQSDIIYILWKPFSIQYLHKDGACFFYVWY